MSKVGESVKSVAGGYKLRARPPEYCAMGDYLDTFSQKLGTIDRITQRILKEQSGIRLMSPTGGRLFVLFSSCFYSDFISLVGRKNPKLSHSQNICK